LISVPPAHASTVTLPATGQSTCYDTFDLVSCSGTGQDGDIRSGLAWPSPRYADNANGTITDRLTGLIWSKDANAPGPSACNPGVAKNWQTAFEYARCLNQNNYLGYNDWRVPNFNEIVSLSHRGEPDPVAFLTSHGFTQIQVGEYLSSTSSAPLFSVSTVTFNSYWNQYESFYLWPVRGSSNGYTGSIALPKTGQTICHDISGNLIACTGTGQDGELQTGVSLPETRFTDNGDFTQTDQLTGLIWTKDTNAPGPETCGSGVYKNWILALEYVACLNLNNYLGYNNWRLPNINELNSLVPSHVVDRAEWLSSQGFVNVPTNTYYKFWSSTSHLVDSYNAWRGDGRSSQAGDKDSNQPVWPVRGGVYGNARLSVTPAVKDFGLVYYGTSGSAVITVANSAIATTSLQINAIGLMGGDANQFTVSVGDGTNGSCGTVTPVLAPNTSCSVTVVFSPTTRGDKNAILRISSSDSQYSNQDVTLVGRADVPSFSITPTVVGGGSVSCTTPVDINLTATCTVSAENGSLASLKDNGVDVRALVVGNTYSIQNIAENHIIEASFVLNAACGESNGKTVVVAPTTGFCAFGMSTLFTGALPWQWTCVGLNGGDDAHCSALTPQHPRVVLPKTGQTICYDTAGIVINCTGTGQDGAIQSGIVWPAQRFTDNQDGTLTDTLTSLVWAKNANILSVRNPEFDMEGIASDGAVSGRKALEYVNKLNQENYLGFNDWRLPNINELRSLIQYGYSDNRGWMQSFGFQNVSDYDYWSSSTINYSDFFTASLWRGYITGSQSETNYKTLIPVRGGSWSEMDVGATVPKTGILSCLYDEPCAGSGEDGELQKGADWPAPRFTPNPDTTITDNLTGLIWTASASMPGPENCAPVVTKTWQEALDYITCLNNSSYLGKTDWRMPNVLELRSIQPDSNFENISSNWWWTSTTYSNLPNYAWYVWLELGYGSIAKKDSKGYVWPVRGGQFGNSIASVTPTSHNYGSLAVGSSQSVVFQIANSASASDVLQVNALSVAGADTADFVLHVGDGSAGSCGTVVPRLQPGSSCQVVVTFAPTSDGNKNAMLKVTSSDVNHPHLEITLSGSAFTLNPTLQVTVIGTGAGTVTSNPAGVSCTSGSCSSSFAKDNSISLTATPDSISTFDGWSGDCTNSSGDCSLTMLANKTVTASFNLAPKVKISRTGMGYSTVQEAETSAQAGDILLLLEDVLSSSLAVTKNLQLKGGYNSSFSSQLGYTTLQGSLSITSGSVVVDRLVIK